ncbi:MAG: hypothetical protein Q7S20_12485 [Gemmatimonadaceae bacterium]|nr:hypothetical protein [Gemmatimonadaceae bacterium]
MAMGKMMRVFSGPDGTRWGVAVKMPTASNAMVVFHHPGGKTSGLDRYAWYQWHGPEARSVTSRVTGDSVMKVLSEDVIDLLFRRSMPISAGANPLVGVSP